MGFGIQTKNRAGETLFTTRHFAIKKIGSGYQKPRIYDSATDSVHNDHYITIPAGYDKSTILVFARPHIFADSEEEAINERIKGYWPMGIRFGGDGDGDMRLFQGNQYFQITAPDNSVRYYGGRRFLGYDDFFDGSREYYTSTEHYGRGFSGAGARGEVYYEIWTVNPPKSSDDPASEAEVEDTSGFGVEVRSDFPGLATFKSNVPNFKVEQSSYIQQNISFFNMENYNNGDRIIYTNMTPQRLFFQNRSNHSQGQYMALLNGSAHTSAIALGGNKGFSSAYQNTAYEIPQEQTAFYQSFVEFHYYDQDDIYGYKPAVVQIPRLAYTKVTKNRIGYLDQVQVNGQVGVPTLALIGKST